MVPDGDIRLRIGAGFLNCEREETAAGTWRSADSLEAVTNARAQGNYQVRFEWGAAGAAVIAEDADALVWVDELGEEPVPGLPGVVAGSIATAEAVARWCLAKQEELGGRFRIAVVAAGVAESDGGVRFAVEDLLGAGAVIDAIAEVGIDHQSPEAAAAAAAYTGLRRGLRHLISASVSARELGAPAFDLTPHDEVRVLRSF